jgi:hypothetical protein
VFLEWRCYLHGVVCENALCRRALTPSAARRQRCRVATRAARAQGVETWRIVWVSDVALCVCAARAVRARDRARTVPAAAARAVLLAADAGGACATTLTVTQRRCQACAHEYSVCVR